MWHRTYPICDASHGHIATGQLRFLTEITPKSPFLCRVNSRSPIWYDFRASAKAILYSVNMALVLDSAICFYVTLQGYRPQKPIEHSTNKGALIPHTLINIKASSTFYYNAPKHALNKSGKFELDWAKRGERGILHEARDQGRRTHKALFFSSPRLPIRAFASLGS